MGKKFVLFTGLVGSDQYMPIDGRLGIERIKVQVVAHAERLRKYHHRTLGDALLCYGSIRTHRVIARWTP